MDRRWISNLSADLPEQERFATYIKNSRGVLDRLTEILNQLETDLDCKELGKDIYETPSWSHQQADNIGYRRAIRDVLRLTTLDPKDN